MATLSYVGFLWSASMARNKFIGARAMQSTSAWSRNGIIYHSTNQRGQSGPKLFRLAKSMPLLRGHQQLLKGPCPKCQSHSGKPDLAARRIKGHKQPKAKRKEREDEEEGGGGELGREEYSEKSCWRNCSWFLLSIFNDFGPRARHARSHWILSLVLIYNLFSCLNMHCFSRQWDIYCVSCGEGGQH